MKRRLSMLVAAIVAFGLIAAIGSAFAANYVWIDSNVKGVGYTNSEYGVDTREGIANGVEMAEQESGTGLVTTQKWTLELNKVNVETAPWCLNCFCVEGLEEEKVLDVEYFPITYQNHSYDQKWQEKKCVKNYLIGAVTDANFVQCEKLQKEETVVTYTGWQSALGGQAPPWYFCGSSLLCPEAALTQTVTADVLGISHIGFAAKDPNEHHHTIAYGKEETIGQFQIEKTIDIRETCNESMVGNWLGCP
jgi:hypothetical protein